MALERGNVVGLRRNATGLIWSLSHDLVWIVPVGGYNGPPPHRAEVRITDLAEIFACGVPFTFPVVRCHQMYKVPRQVADTAPLLGKASNLLVGRIGESILREAKARATERSYYAGHVQTPAFASRHD